MLVQALAAYADTYLSDQLADEAFEEKPVSYELQIYEDGSFAGIRPRMQEVTRGKKPARVPMPMRVPKSPVNRNSCVYPLLACDAIQYVLGPKVGVWTKENDVDKHQRQHEGFLKLLQEAASEVADTALKACVAFYDKTGEKEQARRALEGMKPRGGSVVALSVIDRNPAAENPGGPVVQRPTVRDYWRTRYATSFAERVESGNESMCLISGKLGPVVPTHEKIKGVTSLGGQPSGVSLMSFDKAAFRSYGWEQNANSPVSPDRATAYVLALNDLLRHGEHRLGSSQDKVVRTRFDCGGVGFLFWTRKPSDDDIYALFNEAQPEQVNALLTAPFTGKAAADADPNDFYLVAVSGNGGRLLVRYWFYDKLENIRANIRKWFEGLRIADVFNSGKPSEPPKLGELLMSISSTAKGTPDEKIKKVPPERVVQFACRALHGLPFGRTILAAALARLRAEPGKNRFSPVRMGLIRMCVNDIEGTEKKGEPLMPESLDAGLDHPAYVCGRLLAVYDKLQYHAQGDVNVTVADRYYGMASTYPQLAFPKLETLSKAHLKKLRRDKRGTAVNIEKEIRELMAGLHGIFPSILSLEDQGRFAIGFHHQKAEDAKRASEAKAQKTEPPQAV